MDWLKKIFSKSKADNEKLEAEAEVSNSKQSSSSVSEIEASDMIEIDDDVFEATFAARDRYWSNIGKIDEDVIAHMISPEFQGSPPWPTTRQAYKIIRTENSVILASDGLSDPFVGTDIRRNGYESEVYIETSDLVGASFNEITRSWQFEAIEMWAKNIASYQGINSNLAKYPVMSIQLPIQSAPDNWKEENGEVGFLVNMLAKGRAADISDAPMSPIKVISLTAIRPEELAFITNVAAEDRAAARDDLTNKLNETSGHLTEEKRPNVLE